MDVQRAKSALKEYFGYSGFRPLQEEIICRVYEGKDTIVLMPTGGGKSICFQIPAITLPGTCVVVSPLISLMKDQVEGLMANGVSAAFLNSTQSPSEQREIENELISGKTKLLYLSPEKLVSDGCLQFIEKLEISLFAIDEAHCISSWGHDFRPEYASLGLLKEKFPGIPVMALTATADKVTRKDISERLSLNNPETFIASFDRPNLSLNVLPGVNRYRFIRDFIRNRKSQSGIIYCLSRKNTENLASKLQAEGIAAGAYHAGMSDEARSKTQEAFIQDQLPIICATVAFGMGIDKSNVRYIIHYNLPKNIESYYQQIGRAGRDGLPSETILFYSYSDIMVLMRFIEESKQKELLTAKLERMQQFAEAMICRRKILLNYFNEHLGSDCGNCDVCRNPPKQFDGTILTQKALSAVFRVNEQVGLNMLVDILRGSNRKELLSKGYHQIKTYGAGSELSFYDWQQFIYQMLNLGLLELAYDDNYSLKINEAGRKVLFEKERVQLVRLSSLKEKLAEKVRKSKPKSKRERIRDDLFETLRALRKKIAGEKGLPPYLIFSDAALEEMAATKPLTEADMLEISGVGKQKLASFGKIFIAAIFEYLRQKEKEGEKVQGTSHKITLAFFKQGMDAEIIAEKRNLNPSTIYQHLQRLYTEGEEIDIDRLLSESELKKIRHAVKVTKNSDHIKPLFEELNQEIPYPKIRIALSYLKKEENL